MPQLNKMMINECAVSNLILKQLDKETGYETNGSIKKYFSG